MEPIKQGKDITVRIVKRISIMHGDIGVDLIMHEHKYAREIENTYFTVDYKVRRYYENWRDLIDESEQRFYNRDIAEWIYKELANVWL